MEHRPVAEEQICLCPWQKMPMFVVQLMCPSLVWMPALLPFSNSVCVFCA